MVAFFNNTYGIIAIEVFYKKACFQLILMIFNGANSVKGNILIFLRIQNNTIIVKIPWVDLDF